MCAIFSKWLKTLAVLCTPYLLMAQTVSTPASGLGSSLGGIIMDNLGNTFVSIRSTNEIKKIDPYGNVTVYCGSGLNDPMGLAFDSQWNLYVANYGGQVAVIPQGGGTATNYTTGLNVPTVLKQYDGDTLIVQEYFTKKVFKILPGGGAASSSSVPLIFTPAGGGVAGGLGVYPNKDILAITAYSFYAYRYDWTTANVSTVAGPLGYDPIDISVGIGNEFYFANWGGHTVNVFDGITGTVTAYAGTGVAGGLDGSLNSAQFNYPYYMCNDPLGAKYLTESNSGKIRKISATQCSINNLDAGSDIQACAGDDIQLSGYYQSIFYDSSTYTNNWIGPNGFSSSNQATTLTSVNNSNSGYYVFTATDINGCVVSDSLLITVNTVNASANSNSPLCEGEALSLSATGGTNFSWTGPNGFNSVSQSPTVPNTTQNEAGIYTVEVYDANGCSSSTSLNVTVTSVDVSVTVNDDQLTANQNGASYQWLDCNNSFAPISGATFQQFTAVTNGQYAVVVSYNNCSDTSECQMISDLSLTEFAPGEDWTMYPNPNRGSLALRSKTGGKYELISTNGSIIQEWDILPGETQVQLSLQSGLYLVSHKETGKIQKLIIE